MSHKIVYEWAVEFVDGCGSIDAVDHADTYADALRLAEELREDWVARVDIALARKAYDNIDEDLLGVGYAYVTDGKLPDEFDTGHRVPARFHDEVRA